MIEEWVMAEGSVCGGHSLGGDHNIVFMAVPSQCGVVGLNVELVTATESVRAGHQSLLTLKSLSSP